MAIKFYRKMEPKTNVVLGNNVQIKFTTLDHLLGYYATDQEYVQKELERFMSEGRYAISEIPEKDFHEEYVKKKSLGTLPPPSREEYSGIRRQGSNLVETLGVERVRSVVGIKTVPITVEDVPTDNKPIQPLSAATPESAFKPSVGKRVKRKT